MEFDTMTLQDFIAEGAQHNPYAWMPGWFYCKICKDYKTVISYILGNYDIRHFCLTCKHDINDEGNES